MKNMLKNVTIVGAGTQGSMLAFRSAAFGRTVCLYDLQESQLESAMNKIHNWFGDWVEKDLLSPIPQLTHITESEYQWILPMH